MFLVFFSHWWGDGDVIIIIMLQDIDLKREFENITMWILTGDHGEVNLSIFLCSWCEPSAGVTLHILHGDILYNQRTILWNTQPVWFIFCIFRNLPIFKHCFCISWTSEEPSSEVTWLLVRWHAPTGQRDVCSGSDGEEGMFHSFCCWEMYKINKKYEKWL